MSSPGAPWKIKASEMALDIGSTSPNSWPTCRTSWGTPLNSILILGQQLRIIRTRT